MIRLVLIGFGVYACLPGLSSGLGIDESKVCWSPRPAQAVKTALFSPAKPSATGSRPLTWRAALVATDRPWVDPPVCSAQLGAGSYLGGACNVKAINGHNEIGLRLVVATKPVDVAGYSVTTQNYNQAYLTPVVEAAPGDDVTAHIQNDLKPLPGMMSHGGADDNPTNLHYFHGGIVSPQNARPKDAALGDGDNIFVRVKSGGVFDLNVHIPGPGELNAKVLDGKSGYIAHPTGLGWYHSHEHGVSAAQVTGGMSGLLSVGGPLENVKAPCPKGTPQPQCDSATDALRKSTQVHYALLRDLPLNHLTAPPSEASGAKADLDLGEPGLKMNDLCGVYDATGRFAAAAPRLGFCQLKRAAGPDAPDAAWLFTVNGQRFPTLRVGKRQNLLLRMGNVGANVPYVLELIGEDGKRSQPLTVLSRDGVVPASPQEPGEAARPIVAKNDDNLLLMPAARAEIYVRNDCTIHPEQTLILHTQGLSTGSESRLGMWPEVQLAKIVLEANDTTCDTAVALNAPLAKPGAHGALAATPVNNAPPGCVRDLNPDDLEYRRVTFLGKGDPTTPGTSPVWMISTEIIAPVKGTVQDESAMAPKDPKTSTILSDPDGNPQGIPFDTYETGADQHVDWESNITKHVCIKLDGVGSHHQLWALVNGTGHLHNFHIHQMKFRLATQKELDAHFIAPPNPTSTSLPQPMQMDGSTPKYVFPLLDTTSTIVDGAVQDPDWHDTIPLPPNVTVFVVMNFDATQQVGRFVFHCHILDHEDRGLMAPIEVWDPHQKS